MKKQLPILLLAAIAVALAFGLYNTNRKTKQLQNELANSQAPSTEAVSEMADPPNPEIQAAQSTPQALEAVEPAVPQPAEQPTGARRMMGSMAKMMENPTMNKVMQASQRGAVGALYSDLIEYLNLSAEETNYFMDLLMSRQMKQIDMAMKMMGGNLSEDEKLAMAEGFKKTTEMVKTEMEKFLNNPADVAEWEYYEQTMGERMMLSGVDQKLAGTGAALGDDTYRQVLDIMHQERKNFDFSSDLNDEKNMDLSPERFAKQNLQNHFNDQQRLNESIKAKVEAILTPEQYAAFAEGIDAATEMQKAQLEMAAQMFGGKAD